MKIKPFAEQILTQNLTPLLLSSKLQLYLMSRYGPSMVSTLFLEIQNVMIRSLLSVQQIMMNDKHCFELYGFDVLFDDSFKVYVIEVNASPSMSANTPEDLELKTNMLSSVFDIVDVEGNMTGEEVRVGGFDLVQKGGEINLQGDATDTNPNNSNNNSNNIDKSNKNKKQNDNTSSSTSHGINLGGTGGSPTVNSYSTMLGCDIPKDYIVRSPLANQHLNSGGGYNSKRNGNNNTDDDNDKSGSNNRRGSVNNNNNNDRSNTPSNDTRASSSNSHDKKNRIFV